MGKEVGIVTEVGDLGCGWDPLNESDQALLEQQEKEENEAKKGAK